MTYAKLWADWILILKVRVTWFFLDLDNGLINHLQNGPQTKDMGTHLSKIMMVTAQIKASKNKGITSIQLLHSKENVLILTKISSLAALEVVILTTSSAASDENFVKMKTFPFQCFPVRYFHYKDDLILIMHGNSPTGKIVSLHGNGQLILNKTWIWKNSVELHTAG